MDFGFEHDFLTLEVDLECELLDLQDRIHQPMERLALLLCLCHKLSLSLFVMECVISLQRLSEFSPYLPAKKKPYIFPITLKVTHIHTWNLPSTTTD